MKTKFNMPEVVMTNEEYNTLNEMYHFLLDNKDKFPDEQEKINKYIETLDSIAGDDDYII